jgi:hypothetical protein
MLLFNFDKNNLTDIRHFILLFDSIIFECIHLRYILFLNFKHLKKISNKFAKQYILVNT